MLTFIVACDDQSFEAFTPPEPLADGWIVSTAEAEGFEAEPFEQLIAGIPAMNPKLNSIVIARHGRLIADQYFNGYAADSLHKVWSITKVVSGTLVGIAADENLLSAKDSISLYLGDYMQGVDSSKRGIQIEHLLTMTSGLEWEELGGPGSPGFQMAYAEDWIAFTLSQPHTAFPGATYTYSSGNTMLLGAILKNASGMEAAAYAEARLFKPLGITNYEWDTQSEFWTKTHTGELPGAERPEAIEYKEPFASLTNTATGLRLRPRDMCKIGQLYLNKGTWNNQQIVSAEWTAASTIPHFGNNEYGYHWRLMTVSGQRCFYATGFGLQRIFVFPEPGLVMVMTQDHYSTMPEGNELSQQLVENLLRLIKD